MKSESKLYSRVVITDQSGCFLFSCNVKFVFLYDVKSMPVQIVEKTKRGSRGYQFQFNHEYTLSEDALLLVLEV